MPSLEFKGKPFVYSHHLSVPFRELVIDPKKSLPAKGQKPSLDDNLIIHGDNLEALKALLPRYAGKVDVIYIDPPYNTGNEGWAYNDNVNSPLMKEWLGKVVDRDDLERHDKWCCMMWPRLSLLWELLSDRGSLWITVDDNEAHFCRTICEEIFGGDTFVAQLVWQKRTSRENRTAIASMHDYLLLFAKVGTDDWKGIRRRLASTSEGYANLDDDPRGPWVSVPFSAQGYRPNQMYVITSPTGQKLEPPRGRCWAATEPVFKKLLADNRIYFPRGGDGRPRVKQFRDEDKGLVPSSLWLASEVGDNEDSKKELMEIFSQGAVFDTPKPIELIRRIVEIASDKQSICLDSFAGSGTTAHAVLAQNTRDDGSRRFILVEAADYANSTTAERVRRAIKGVPTAKIDMLQKGLGGSFTYCELGESLDLNRFFDGKGAPSYEQVGRYVVYTATGQSIPDVPKEPRKDWFVGEAGGYRIHLIYKPDLAFMRGNDAALTMPLAEQIAKAAKGKPVLVYAAAKFMSQSVLTKKGITFCQLPYSVHRVLGEAPDAP